MSSLRYVVRADVRGKKKYSERVSLVDCLTA